jgi:hypothetical protein
LAWLDYFFFKEHRGWDLGMTSRSRALSFHFSTAISYRIYVTTPGMKSRFQKSLLTEASEKPIKNSFRGPSIARPL